MDSTKVQLVKPSGGMGTLNTSDEMTVKQVLREVADGGWVVLKGCTRATAGCAKKDIVHHKVRPLWDRKERADEFPSWSKQS